MEAISFFFFSLHPRKHVAPLMAAVLVSILYGMLTTNPVPEKYVLNINNQTK
jgi:hypothetical protein